MKKIWFDIYSNNLRIGSPVITLWIIFTQHFESFRHAEIKVKTLLVVEQNTSLMSLRNDYDQGTMGDTRTN